MNFVYITGKIYNIESYEDCILFRVRVTEPSGSYSIKCRAYGNLIRYVQSELLEYDDVCVQGKLIARTYKLDDNSGFRYTAEIKARFISKLVQMEYGAYYDEK